MSRPHPSLWPLLLALSACGTPIPGSYTLETYNGEPSPFEVGGAQMTSIDLQLNADGTCVLTATTDGSEVTLDTEEGCSWSAEGTEISVATVFESSSVTGTVIDGTMTLGSSDAYVLVKR